MAYKESRNIEDINYKNKIWDFYSKCVLHKKTKVSFETFLKKSQKTNRNKSLFILAFGLFQISQIIKSSKK